MTDKTQTVEQIAAACHERVVDWFHNGGTDDLDLRPTIAEALTRQAQVSELAGTYSDHGVHPERLLRQTDKAQVSDDAVVERDLKAITRAAVRLTGLNPSLADELMQAKVRFQLALSATNKAVSELVALLERALVWVEGAEPYSVREGKRKDALQAEIETALAKLGSRAP
jgi:transposase InsO family protein